MSEHGKNPNGEIMGQFNGIDEVVYENGPIHYYGVDAAGKKHPIKEADLLGNYGYSMEYIDDTSAANPAEVVESSAPAEVQIGAEVAPEQPESTTGNAYVDAYNKIGQTMKQIIEDKAKKDSFDIMDMAVTERDLLSKIVIINPKGAKDGNPSEYAGYKVTVGAEGFTEDDAKKLDGIISKIGRNNFLDLVRTSHSMERAEKGGKVERASETPRELDGIEGVEKSINQRVRQLKAIKRARGGENVEEIDAKIESMQANLETAVDKARESEENRNRVTRTRVERRVAKALGDFDILDFYEYPSTPSDGGDKPKPPKGPKGSGAAGGGDGDKPKPPKGSGDGGEPKDPEVDPVLETESMEKLRADLDKTRAEYARMIVGRKNSPFFSRKFSKKNVVAAGLDYQKAREKVDSQALKLMNDEEGLSAEDKYARLNTIFKDEAYTLINAQKDLSLQTKKGRAKGTYPVTDAEGKVKNRTMARSEYYTLLMGQKIEEASAKAEKEGKTISKVAIDNIIRNAMEAERKDANKRARVTAGVGAVAAGLVVTTLIAAGRYDSYDGDNTPGTTASSSSEGSTPGSAAPSSEGTTPGSEAPSGTEPTTPGSEAPAGDSDSETDHGHDHGQDHGGLTEDQYGDLSSRQQEQWDSMSDQEQEDVLEALGSDEFAIFITESAKIHEQVNEEMPIPENASAFERIRIEFERQEEVNRRIVTQLEYAASLQEDDSEASSSDAATSVTARPTFTG